MDKKLTQEEIIEKVLAGKMTVVTGMHEYAARSNQYKNETINELIRQRDTAQSRIGELEEAERGLTQVRDELWKRIETLTEHQTIYLSKISQLERENAKERLVVNAAQELWNKVNHNNQETIESLDKSGKSKTLLIEKLMGELEKEIKAYTMGTDADPVAFWQSYCNEKGFIPPPAGS